MKKLIALLLALILVLSLVACGSNSGGTSQSGAQGGGQQLITEDRKTGDDSMARQQYFAETVRDEFTFDKSGILTGYKCIYTFIDGTSDKDKQDGLDSLIGGNFAANIVGNTIVVDGNGNYLGFPYVESNLNEIKERLDKDGKQYTLK